MLARLCLMSARTLLRPVVVPALLVFLATLGATAARADLSVTGGTAAQQELLNRAYSGLPACCHTPRPVAVRLLDDQAMNACLQACAAAHSQRLVNADAVDGFYQNACPTITLRAPSATADVSATFTHEYGHYVWMKVLSAAQRDQYRKIYDTQRSAHHLITQYAAVSVDEGFAEAFAAYIHDYSGLCQRDSLSCCYLVATLNPRTRN